MIAHHVLTLISGILLGMTGGILFCRANFPSLYLRVKARHKPY